MYRVRAEGDPNYAMGDPIPLALLHGVKKLKGVGRYLKGKLKRGPKAAARLLRKHKGALGALEEQIAGVRGKGLRGGFQGAGGRRMRVTNPKALRRALRRVTGFAKTVKRTKRAIARAASAVGVHRGRPGRSGHPAGCRCVHCARSAS